MDVAGTDRLLVRVATMKSPSGSDCQIIRVPCHDF
jgi:hypothetical protein